MNKVQRNALCPCGSGKKYKKCCMNETALDPILVRNFGEFGARSLENELRQMEGSYPDEATTKTAVNTLERIIKQKADGNRPKPSEKLILKQSIIDDNTRKYLLDIVGYAVDYGNLTGRSDMCVYFAVLLTDALKYMDYPAKSMIGKATYSSTDNKNINFSWDHAWVILDNEVIDGNVDMMAENPSIPNDISPKNYWGPIDDLPRDRIFLPTKEIDENWIKGNMEYDFICRNRVEVLLKINLPKMPDSD